MTASHTQFHPGLTAYKAPGSPLTGLAAPWAPTSPPPIPPGLAATVAPEYPIPIPGVHLPSQHPPSPLSLLMTDVSLAQVLTRPAPGPSAQGANSSWFWDVEASYIWPPVQFAP